MPEQTIRFDDGAAYEQMMGIWSRFAGEIFLDWLAPPAGLRWIDVGCGTGAFTQLLVERCAPAEMQGIDPSEGQLAFARTRSAARLAEFRVGDAMALPFPAGTFDAAVMALVLVFVPEPAKGIAEMARVVRPGGLIATYMWDMLGGGFPLDPILVEMRAMGLAPPRPPRMEASGMDEMRELWTGAGLGDVETREIVVQRTYASFDDFWTINAKSPSMSGIIAAMTPGDVDWYVRRFMRLRQTAFRDPAAYFHRYATLSIEEAQGKALEIWTTINRINLDENILPTRQRARLILRKSADHRIESVALRKL